LLSARQQQSAVQLAAIVTSIALKRFNAFARDDWNHENRGYRICPPPSKQGVESESNK
jgi:hypothetical protein